MGNQIRTTILLAVITAIIIWIGQLFGGRQGMIIALLFAAMIIQMAISRSREYLADSSGARFAGTPEGLARALDKLGRYSKKLPMDANPSTAHMFIVNPLSGRSLMSLFSTHPPLEERIVRLRGYPSSASPVSKSGGDAREAKARAFWDRLSK